MFSRNKINLNIDTTEAEEKIGRVRKQIDEVLELRPNLEEMDELATRILDKYYEIEKMEEGCKYITKTMGRRCP